jgi:hypothetical protein
MVLLDLFEVLPGCLSYIDSSVGQNEVHTLHYTVDDDHNCVVAMDFG